MTDTILSRAAEGERITTDEAVALYRDAPLEDLGAAADAVVRRRYGDAVTYNVNAHLNPTNICVVGCGFCAFAVWTEKDERAYAYSVDQLVDRAHQLSELGITELHIVGGMTKEYDLPYYEELFSELKASLPHVSLTALTAVEVNFIARISKVDHAEALRRLRAAGHDTMPGGGAEVFSPRVRKIIADRKVPAEVWLDVHREAHRQGLRTNATLLFGHFETPEEQVNHMRALRDLQDDTGGFQAFIPLPFLPGNTDFSYLPGPTGGEAAHDRGRAPVPRLVPARQGPLGDAGRGDHVRGAGLRPGRPLGHAHRGAHRARHHRADAARPLARSHGDARSGRGEGAGGARHPLRARRAGADAA